MWLPCRICFVHVSPMWITGLKCCFEASGVSSLHKAGLCFNTCHTLQIVTKSFPHLVTLTLLSLSTLWAVCLYYLATLFFNLLRAHTVWAVQQPVSLLFNLNCILYFYLVVLYYLAGLYFYKLLWQLLKKKSLSWPSKWQLEVIAGTNKIASDSAVTPRHVETLQM